MYILFEDDPRLVGCSSALPAWVSLLTTLVFKLTLAAIDVCGFSKRSQTFLFHLAKLPFPGTGSSSTSTFKLSASFLISSNTCSFLWWYLEKKNNWIENWLDPENSKFNPGFDPDNSEFNPGWSRQFKIQSRIWSRQFKIQIQDFIQTIQNSIQDFIQTIQNSIQDFIQTIQIQSKIWFE